MTKDYDILVIGELNVDLILKGDDVTPEFGQTEKLVSDAALVLGSSSAIFACGAARLGLRVGFLGKVGDDEFGHFLIKTMDSRGIDTSPVIVDSRVKTGLTVHLSTGHDRAMMTFLGSITALAPHELDESLIGRTRHIHQSSFFMQRGVQAAIPGYFHTARQAGVTVSLDPGWDPLEQWSQVIGPALEQIDVFLPNEQEALAILGAENLDQAFLACETRFHTCAVKRGARGSAASRGKERCSRSVYPVTVVDTVGAGDSFNAGFLYGFLHGLDLCTCLAWGNACGALSTTGVGGIAAQPTAQEAQQFMNQQGSSESSRSVGVESSAPHPSGSHSS